MRQWQVITVKSLMDYKRNNFKNSRYFFSARFRLSSLIGVHPLFAVQFFSSNIPWSEPTKYFFKSKLWSCMNFTKRRNKERWWRCLVVPPILQCYTQHSCHLTQARETFDDIKHYRWSCSSVERKLGNWEASRGSYRFVLKSLNISPEVSYIF